MENLVVEPTKSSPAVFFDAQRGVFEIKGKSYPENPSKFYAPVLEWLSRYLDAFDDGPVELKMEIIYLNSSSSKAFLNIFELLDQAALKGRKVVINWYYHEENETALECGEEFMEEVQTAKFNLVQISEE